MIAYLLGCLHAVIPHAQCPTTMPTAVLHIASPSQSQGLLYPPAWKRESVGLAGIQLVRRLSKRHCKLGLNHRIGHYRV